ncbi:MAG TPA: hypothetical protein VFY39_02195 [Gammaproteobacteria bacterium]|nr:hypothetical protein [Gammaproteobacteria bacterium]
MLALVSTSLWAGEVYRSFAPDGTVIYSDVPFGTNAEPIFIAAPQPASEARGANRSASGDQKPAAEPAAAAGGAKPAAPTPEELAKERAENCRIARDRAQRYSVAHRLYRNLPNGQREYLTDAEIDKAKAEAAADVERWCN